MVDCMDDLKKELQIHRKEMSWETFQRTYAYEIDELTEELVNDGTLGSSADVAECREYASDKIISRNGITIT
tara:strand:- start:249 stop:464 length:216 start_codon:yes stop_codon:yes gene_type:complete